MSLDGADLCLSWGAPENPFSKGQGRLSQWCPDTYFHRGLEMILFQQIGTPGIVPKVTSPTGGILIHLYFGVCAACATQLQGHVLLEASRSFSFPAKIGLRHGVSG